MNAVEIYEKASWDLEHNKITLGEFEERIKPLYDVEPVRHGRWQCEEVPCIYGKKFILTCSECGESVSVTESALMEEHYCRSCGARMNEEDQGDKEYEDSILAAQKSEE